MLSITLKSHQRDQTCSVPFGASIQTVVNNYNQTRLPSSQISKLYNPYGQEIPAAAWTVQIKENMTFCIDQIM